MQEYDENNDGVYIISGKVEFDTLDNILYNFENNTKTTMLRTSARCLSILIKKRNEVVLQNELLEYIWGENHVNISHNTFYQCIFHLRNALTDAGIDNGLVKTIPRRGIMLDESCVSEIVRGKIAVDDETDSYIPQPASSAPWNNIFNSYFLYVFLFLITLASIFFIGCFISRKNSGSGYFFDYVAQPSLSGNCKVFFDRDVKSYTRHRKYMKDNYKSLCQDGNELYVTAFLNTKNISVLSCHRPSVSEKRMRCTSIYYPEYF
ncbi:winged helix-turn-helix domain-containing protein [Enterobacter sp. KE9933]|uniref:winged helix-turn-helix domain-containing protein n=1 Tax=Enterobacter sp. KE9933 TaxID=3118153 RepID=UPI003753A2A1